MNRSDRRRLARDEGKSFAAEQRMRREAERAERAALRLTPEQARETLARWAAQPGRSQAEVDALNGAQNGKI